MKKLFSTILVLAMTLGLCTPFAFAKTSSFPDVPSPQYDWAIDAIEAMLAEGYIKGYTDKTFKPANAVTKMESLIFAARLKGVLIADNKPFIDFATQLYADDLAAYSFGYKSEVSYLLYKGTITANELGAYLSADQINTPLKRYEAAKLLTNIMGGAATGTSVDFADSASIPKDYVPYVAYVVEKGLMNGVGANNFDPQGTVTRAQISVMLKRVIDAVALSIDVGTVTTVNRDTYTINVTGTDGKTGPIPWTKPRRCM